MVGTTAQDREQGLSRLELKLVALAVMVVDHAATALVEWPLRYGQPSAVPLDTRCLETVALGAHAVGRLAFPVFAFLLVEGFFHTRSRVCYLRRLLVWAVVSEFPFDLGLLLWPSAMRRGIWWEWDHQNVLLSLAIGFCVMWGLEWLRWRRAGREPLSGFVRTAWLLAGAAVVGLGCLVAWLLRVDYGWQGVATIVAAYMVRPTNRPWIAALAMLAVLVLFSSFELWALLAVPLLARYNGMRGGSRGTRTFFYAFYPVHLLVLGLLRLVLVAT